MQLVILAGGKGTRLGLTDIPKPMCPVAGKPLLERQIELATEGQRYFDVRRWMIAPQTESKTMHGIEITRATDGTKTWKEFDVRTHVWRPAMYFFPIPYNETVKSKDLLQNPYYN